MADKTVLLILNSNITAQDVRLLQRNKWLSENFKITDAAFDKNSCCSTFGLDIEKTRNICRSIRQPYILFTNIHIAGGKSAYADNGVFIFSSSRWNADYRGIDLRIIFLFHILKWQTNNVIRCSQTKCLISSSLDKLNFSLCPQCQEELVRIGKEEVVTRTIALENVATMKIEDVNKYLTNTLAYTLHELRVSSNSPIANVAISDAIINYKASLTSPTRKYLKKASTEILSAKKKNKDDYINKAKKRLKFQYPIIIAARRWNSWTPARPSSIKKAKTRNDMLGLKTGGGYFISDGTTRISIDPGYGYLELLFDFYGLTVADIDAIIITHDHPDHSAELMNILTLRHVYRKYCNPLYIYLNPSTFYIYKNHLEYYTPVLADGNPIRVEPGNSINIGNFTIKTFGMYHKEIIDDCKRFPFSSAVGHSKTLGLSISGKSVHIKNQVFNVALVGDTALPRTFSEYEALIDFFGSPDIAALHLGSIEKKWSTARQEAKASLIRYDGDHLGVIGCSKLIASLQPRVAVITEFGEELDEKDYRINIADVIRNFSICTKSIVLPSDIGLALIFKGDEIYYPCMECKNKQKKYVPIGKLQTIKDDEGFLQYAPKAGCSSGHEHFSI